MRTFLICNRGEDLNGIGLARWLASFSTLSGILVLREAGMRKWKRIRREVNRVGAWRFLDVLAFRVYYRFFLASADRTWEMGKIQELCHKYPALSASTPILEIANPNSAEAREFIRKAAPDLMIARCKTLLKEEIYSIPTSGTVVMHPGICPEYRNAHGCFWAFANNDLERVGMTLLRIDRGVDTGPVFQHYYCNYDELKESHIIIQYRTVFDNLDLIRDKLIEIADRRAVPLETLGRASGEWGQPWLSKYLRWKRRARQELGAR